METNPKGGVQRRASSFFSRGDILRYYHETSSLPSPVYGETYICDHPAYSSCTLYKQYGIGLAVIQQRYDPKTKTTWWSEIDSELTGELYLSKGFYEFFKKYAGRCVLGLYPTVTVRQIMWALRLKPLPKQRWETVFDHKDI